MLLILCKYIVILFGLFIIAAGFVMLFNPERARRTLRKAGSTNFINYAEITIRLIPAIAMILVADSCKVPIAFTLFGWIMVITSFVLYVIPRKMHHAFAMKSADFLEHSFIRSLSPISMLFGGLIIYNVW
jgi:hypothetical protein